MHYVSPVLSYFGLRSYNGGAAEIGTEQTPQDYVASLVEVFRGVSRVLRDDGTLWMVLGDSYASSSTYNTTNSLHTASGWKQDGAHRPNVRASASVPAKNLLMIPHRVALALQEDGWYVRNDCVWAKGAAMPESVQDRFSRAHEYVFHLAKSAHYYFDALAVTEKSVSDHASGNGNKRPHRLSYGDRGQEQQWLPQPTRNRRSVLHINPQPFNAADYGVKEIDHYAVFPEKLVEVCMLAATSEAGCCAQCGAPWRRVVDDGVVGGRVNGATRTRDRPVPRPQTKSWTPGCCCGAPSGTRPDDWERIGTPLGQRVAPDPSLALGGRGYDRPRADDEGRPVITRYEQRQYATQIGLSPHRGAMESALGRPLDHYRKLAASSARPLPAGLLEDWIGRGWLERVVIPQWSPPPPVPCTVLDPFAGSGTVGLVSRKLGRNAVLIDLNPAYCALAQRRVDSLPYSLFSAADSTGTEGAAR